MSIDRVCIRPVSARGWEVTIIEGDRETASAILPVFTTSREASDAAAGLRRAIGLPALVFRSGGVYHGPVRRVSP